MTDKQLMQMALDALDKYGFMPLEDEIGWQHFKKTIEALRARLAQPEPEPVAWWHDMGDVVDLNVSGRKTPLYTAPIQREWQGLTDEEIENCFEMSMFGTCRAIEAKLKEKNG